MSKDKGSKNVKKPKADKTAGKKVVSDYKAEGKSKNPSTIDAFTPKPGDKTGGTTKKK